MRTLTSQPPTLEELFLRHYGEELLEAGLSATAELVEAGRRPRELVGRPTTTGDAVHRAGPAGAPGAAAATGCA